MCVFLEPSSFFSLVPGSWCSSHPPIEIPEETCRKTISFAEHCEQATRLSHLIKTPHLFVSACPTPCILLVILYAYNFYFSPKKGVGLALCEKRWCRYAVWACSTSDWDPPGLSFKLAAAFNWISLWRLPKSVQHLKIASNPFFGHFFYSLRCALPLLHPKNSTSPNSKFYRTMWEPLRFLTYSVITLKSLLLRQSATFLKELWV